MHLAGVVWRGVAEVTVLEQTSRIMKPHSVMKYNYIQDIPFWPAP